MAKSFTYTFYEECAMQAEQHPNGSSTFLVDNGSKDPPLYTAYPGIHNNDAFLGFGGARFTFVKPDGTIFESNNVWHRGNLSEIPKTLVGRFETWKLKGETC